MMKILSCFIPLQRNVLLLTCLLANAVSAAESVVIPVPAYRPPESVQRIAVPVVPDENKYRVLIVSGQSSYEHDWTGVNARIRTAMLDSQIMDVRVVEDFSGANAGMLSKYDVVFLNYLGRWNYTDEKEQRWGAEIEQALFDFVSRGGGIVIFHASFNMGSPSWPEFERLAGGTMRPFHGSRRAPPDAFMLHVVNSEHPVTAGMREYFWTFMDDMYTNMYWHPDAKVNVLVSAFDSAEYYNSAMAGPKYPESLYTPEKLRNMQAMNSENPQVWTVEYGSGRVFCIALGHGPDTVMYDGVNSLILRGTEWAASGKVTLPIGDKARAFSQ